MKKFEREYKEIYGDIPNTQSERVAYLLKDMNLSRSKVRIEEEMKRIRGIGWDEYHFLVKLIPKATPRPRKGKGNIFYVKGAKDNKDLFNSYLNNSDIQLITTPTEFYCKCYLPIPTSMKPVDKILAELGFIYPTSKPDVDNLAKAYCDMIQGLVLYDDALVVKMVSEKYYSVKPRIEIVVRYMKDYDCQFNKNKIMRKDD